MYIRVISPMISNSQTHVAQSRARASLHDGCQCFYRVYSDTAFERHGCRIPINDDGRGERQNIQMFRERLSYKRRQAYATMSKVSMGNSGFYGCMVEPQGVSTWLKERAQRPEIPLSRSAFICCAESP